MYEFKMVLFDNSKKEEFLLFIRNLNMMFNALEMLVANMQTHYISTLLCGYDLRKFDNLCAKLGCMAMAHLNWIILGLGMYFPPVNTLSKKNYEM